jgi:hypothetical protein
MGRLVLYHPITVTVGKVNVVNVQEIEIHIPSNTGGVL